MTQEHLHKDNSNAKSSIVAIGKTEINDTIWNSETVALRSDLKVRTSHSKMEYLKTMYAYRSECLNRNNDFRRNALGLYFVVDDSIFLYTAFFDSRTKFSYVRILAMISKYGPDKPNLWCHFLDENNEHSSTYVTVRGECYEMNESHGMLYGGWIISCRTPKDSIPCDVFVSKFETFDKSAIRLPIMLTEAKTTSQNRINVCVPPLFGNISEFRIIEFIELGITMGVDHFTFYAFEVSRRITKVLNFYIKHQVVTVIPWKLPFPNRLYVWYNGQMVAINDCLYRSMAFFSHVAFMDIDEMVVPQGNLFNWRELLVTENSEDAAGFSFVSVNFPVAKNLSGSNSLLTLEARKRSPEFIKVRSKVITRPNRVFEMGIHHVSRPWPDEKKYVIKYVHPIAAYLYHFVSGICKPLPCKELITDETIPKKYGHILEKRYSNALNGIG